MINFIVALIAFFGLIVGWFIAKYTKEEIKDGKKYFKWLHKLFVLVLIAVLVYFNFNLYILALGTVVGYFIRQSYFYLGMVSFDFVSYFVFLFGLSYSALKKYNRRFLIVSLVLFLIGFLIANIYKSELYYSFVAGALLWRLIDVIPNKFRII